MNIKKAFTLVELLVVIAILSVLAALLLPSLDESMRQAKRIVCMNNLRQIAFGSINYAVDIGDRIPRYQSWAPYRVASNTHGWSSGREMLLRIASDDENTLYCPMSPFNAKSRTPNYMIQGWTHAGYPCLSYSMVGLWMPTNYQLKAVYDFGFSARKLLIEDLPPPAPGQYTNRPEKMSQIQKPSDLAVATDCQNSYNCDMSSGFTYPGDLFWNNSLEMWPNFYPHRTYDGSWEGSTASFFDGHAEYKTFEKLLTGTTYPFGVKMRKSAGRVTYEGTYYW